MVSAALHPVSDSRDLRGSDIGEQPVKVCLVVNEVEQPQRFDLAEELIVGDAVLKGDPVFDCCLMFRRRPLEHRSLEERDIGHDVGIEEESHVIDSCNAVRALASLEEVTTLADTIAALEVRLGVAESA